MVRTTGRVPCGYSSFLVESIGKYPNTTSNLFHGEAFREFRDTKDVFLQSYLKTELIKTVFFFFTPKKVKFVLLSFV